MQLTIAVDAAEFDALTRFDVEKRHCGMRMLMDAPAIKIPIKSMMSSFCPILMIVKPINTRKNAIGIARSLTFADILLKQKPAITPPAICTAVAMPAVAVLPRFAALRWFEIFVPPTLKISKKKKAITP